MAGSYVNFRSFLPNVYRNGYTGILGRWTLDTGCWTLDAWLWRLDSRRWTLTSELWTLDAALWPLDTVLDCFRTEPNPVPDSAWLNYWKFFVCKYLWTSWSRLFCRNYRFWPGFFQKFYINFKYYVVISLKRNCLISNYITSNYLGLFRSRRLQLSIFEISSRKHWWQTPSFGQITDWLFRVAIIC